MLKDSMQEQHNNMCPVALLQQLDISSICRTAVLNCCLGQALTRTFVGLKKQFLSCINGISNVRVN